MDAPKMRWSTIVIIILVIAIVIMGVSVFILQASNKSANQNNIIYPFSAVIHPGDQTIPIKNSLGKSQIDCSEVGGRVNVIGAWVEVSDAYGTCTGTSASALNTTCGLPGEKTSCSQDSDCGTGMGCVGGLCKASVCPRDGSPNGFDKAQCKCGGYYCPVLPGKKCTPSKNDCGDPNIMSCKSTGNDIEGVCIVNPGQVCMAPDPFDGKYCALYPVCSNLKTDGKNAINLVCDPKNGTFKCKPRDASAYLAAKCDGHATCNVTYDPLNPNSGFGPLPCSGLNPGASDYKNLPVIQGQGGSYNQGYYVHGLYTCIVD